MSSWWQQLGEGLSEDFSDLPGPASIARGGVRLLVAAVLGGLLGYQRERSGKNAGMRTHILVAVGAALLVLAGHQAGMSSSDVSRIMQGIVTGIGFLGAGTILKHQDPNHVRGLTTAAGIWLTAAVGMTAGLGREGLAILSTLLAWLVLVALPHVAGPRDGNHH
jgi:putative Mg2+ transporter-C (MgtC) family protein